MIKKVSFYILKSAILFILCGLIYVFCEILFRSYSHSSMFFLAGFCAVFFIDTPNNIYSFDLGYLKQISISTLLCTLAEGITGLYVNVYQGWHVWDYSNLPFTFFFGQCNLFFAFIWALMIAFAIPFCDAFNYYVCKLEPCPYYKINGKVFFRFPERKIA